MDTKITIVIAAVLVIAAGAGAYFLISGNGSHEGDLTKVDVAVISGDIHQIALHAGAELGFFGEYGIEVVISPASDGGGIATALMSGDAKLGLMGAPPSTINMVNTGAITGSGVQDKARAYNILARVNSEGSGLFINEEKIDYKDEQGIPYRNATPFYSLKSDGTYNVTEANANAWGGLIFATPGPTSIQHIQLNTIAYETGLEYKPYLIDTVPESNVIYYVTKLSNYALIVADPSVNAGIIWEPQYQKIIQESGKYVDLGLTNFYFPDHTCCIIAGNYNYIHNNEVTVEKFLAAYYKAVNFIADALDDPTSTNYKWLIEFSLKKVPNLTEDEVKDALANIAYLYADGADGNLSMLKADIKSLMEGLATVEAITLPSNINGFINSYVDDTYLMYAIGHLDDLKKS